MLAGVCAGTPQEHGGCRGRRHAGAAPDTGTPALGRFGGRRSLRRSAMESNDARDGEAEPPVRWFPPSRTCRDVAAAVRAHAAAVGPAAGVLRAGHTKVVWAARRAAPVQPSADERERASASHCIEHDRTQSVAGLCTERERCEAGAPAARGRRAAAEAREPRFYLVCRAPLTTGWGTQPVLVEGYTR